MTSIGLNPYQNYVDAPSCQALAEVPVMPVFRTNVDAGAILYNELSYNRNTGGYAVYSPRYDIFRYPPHDEKERKPRMLLDLTPAQYEYLEKIKEDWAHVAKVGRKVDREIVLPLAKKLFGDIEIVLSTGAPTLNTHSYERLIDTERMDHLLNEVLWSVMSDVLQRDIRPQEYDLFFKGIQDYIDGTREAALDNLLCKFAVLDFAHRALELPELQPYGETLLFVRSVGGFYFEHPGKLIIYEFPTEIHSSADFGRTPVLHNPDGPAIGYSDGSGVYVIEGFQFAPRIVTDRASITVAEVENEPNAERRRILTDQMGISRYLHETNAKVIDMDSVRVMTVGDDDRRMPRALIEAKDGRRFLCGTDGSTKRVYYMPVPRDVLNCRMAHEAIAGPVGSRRVRLERRGGWNPELALGLDEKDCIAQS